MCVCVHTSWLGNFSNQPTIRIENRSFISQISLLLLFYCHTFLPYTSLTSRNFWSILYHYREHLFKNCMNEMIKGATYWKWFISHSIILLRPIQVVGCNNHSFISIVECDSIICMYLVFNPFPFWRPCGLFLVWDNYESTS